MRLYHRRSSVYRDRTAIGSAAASTTQAGCANGSVVRNLSQPQITIAPSQLHVTTTTTPGYQRQRSHSLFVVDNSGGGGGGNAAFSLCVPLPRSRSNSFSGVHVSRTSSAFALVAQLTDKEEDYIFNCYAKVMYFILGLTAMLLVFVVIHTMQAIFRL